MQKPTEWIKITQKQFNQVVIALQGTFKELKQEKLALFEEILKRSNATDVAGLGLKRDPFTNSTGVWQSYNDATTGVEVRLQQKVAELQTAFQQNTNNPLKQAQALYNFIKECSKIDGANLQIDKELLKIYDKEWKSKHTQGVEKLQNFFNKKNTNHKKDAIKQFSENAKEKKAEEKLNLSATAIQTAWRGYKARKDVAKLKDDKREEQYQISKQKYLATQSLTEIRGAEVYSKLISILESSIKNNVLNINTKNFNKGLKILQQANPKITDMDLLMFLMDSGFLLNKSFQQITFDFSDNPSLAKTLEVIHSGKAIEEDQSKTTNQEIDVKAKAQEDENTKPTSIIQAIVTAYNESSDGAQKFIENLNKKLQLKADQNIQCDDNAKAFFNGLKSYVNNKTLEADSLNHFMQAQGRGSKAWEFIKAILQAFRNKFRRDEHEVASSRAMRAFISTNNQSTNSQNL